jgi:hypothetical protein
MPCFSWRMSLRHFWTCSFSWSAVGAAGAGFVKEKPLAKLNMAKKVHRAIKSKPPARARAAKSGVTTR